jgi:hypothetical protein
MASTWLNVQIHRAIERRIAAFDFEAVASQAIAAGIDRAGCHISPPAYCPLPVRLKRSIPFCRFLRWHCPMRLSLPALAL